MKKILSAALALVLLSALLSTVALAALPAPTVDGVWLDAPAAGFAVTPCAVDGTPVPAGTGFDCNSDGSAEPFYAAAARFKVAYTPAGGLNEGDSYVILLHSGDSISLRSIHYIDERTVTAEEAQAGTLLFEVFPEVLSDGVIQVTSDAPGFSGPVTVTRVHQYLAYKLGDVDENGKVTTLDAVTVLQYYVGSITLTANQKLAGDTDRDGKITTLDAVTILQYYVGSIKEF